MEAGDPTRPSRRRNRWIAVGLAVLNPAFGMLYVGRPGRAAAYLLLTIACPFVAFVLARSGLWPAGLTWIPFVYLVAVVGAVDAYRIAKPYEAGFDGPWFTTWQGLTAAAACMFALIIGARAFVFEPFRTPSSAMLPTLHAGDQFFVSKLAYRDAQPQRGDIVVLRLPDAGVAYVKRVIGLPGDVVVYDASSKRLTVNGAAVTTEPLGPYDENPAFEVVRESLGARSHLLLVRPDMPGRGGTYEVPDGHYFVLGDHRDNSRDSRFADFEFVPAASIVGKVSVVWWNTDDPARAGLVPD